MRNNSVNIIVFGASGKTGSMLTQHALAHGHHVTAFVRLKSKIKFIDENLTVVEGNINDPDRVRTAIRGKDVVISTLGVSKTFHHDPEVVNGISTIVNAMKLEHVERMIYLSVFLANAKPSHFSFFAHKILNRIIRAEVVDHESKERIVSKNVKSFTIVKATRLIQKPFTGNYKHGENLVMKSFLPSINTGDVADFIVQQLNDNQYINKHVYVTAK